MDPSHQNSLQVDRRNFETLDAAYDWCYRFLNLSSERAVDATLTKLARLTVTADELVNFVSGAKSTLSRITAGGKDEHPNSCSLVALTYQMFRAAERAYEESDAPLGADLVEWPAAALLVAVWHTQNQMPEKAMEIIRTAATLDCLNGSGLPPLTGRGF